MKQAVLSYFLFFGVVHFASADSCADLQKLLPPDHVFKECALDGVRSPSMPETAGVSGPGLEIFCDEPRSQRGSILGFISARTPLASLRDVKIMLSLGLDEALQPLATLNVTKSQKTLEDVGLLTLRALCEPGQSPLYCERLAPKVQVLQTLANDGMGVSQTQVNNIRTGFYQRKKLVGLGLIFSVPLSQMKGCAE